MVKASSKAGIEETITPTKGIRQNNPAKNPRVVARGMPMIPNPIPTIKPTMMATNTCPLA